MDQEQQDGQQQQPRWRPTRKQILWAGAALALLTIAILIGYRYDITLWDWLKLLVVPAVIAGGGIWFNRQQRERELEIANQQRERELEIAQQQREQELEIAERRTQDEALQGYLDQMSEMLLPNKDQPSLYKARPGDSLSSVARARTLTVLSRLDDKRKGRVVQFLYEAGLITKGRPVLDLRGADLREANLIGADLKGVYLRGTLLMGAKLGNADLSVANLRGADLTAAYMPLANLRGADLSRATLYGAHLAGADLSEACLNRAILSTAELSYVHLIGTTLTEANLMGVDLTGAVLSEARGITNDELEQLASSLQWATMPNGQEYEDWLKDRERRKQNE